MNFSKNYSKNYDVFEIEGTDFYVEICKDSFEPKNVEVWLCREKYGVKDLMFSIEKSDDFLEIIEANVADHIKDFNECFGE